MQGHGEEAPPSALVSKLHGATEDSRLGLGTVAREGSHQADAVVVPAAASANRENKELAAVAINQVAVCIPFLPNSPRENRVCVLRAAGMRDAFIAERRNNCRVSAKPETAEDRQPKNREVQPAGVGAMAPVRGQAQAADERLRA